jgi:hypothetical protein
VPTEKQKSAAKVQEYMKLSKYFGFLSHRRLFLSCGQRREAMCYFFYRYDFLMENHPQDERWIETGMFCKNSREYGANSREYWEYLRRYREYLRKY